MTDRPVDSSGPGADDGGRVSTAPDEGTSAVTAAKGGNGADGADGDAGGVSLRRLWLLVRPHRWPVFVATALMLVASGVGLVIPWLAGQVVDLALADATGVRLRSVVLSLIGLFAVLGLINGVELYLLGSAGARLMRDLRQRVFDHLVSLSPDFFAERRVGELLSRLASDLTALRAALTQQLPGGAQAVMRFVGTLALLLWLQTRLTLVALLVVPPVVLLAMFIGRRLERVSTRETDAAAQASAFAEEALAGIRTVQSFGFERQAEGRYRDELATLLRRNLRMARLHSIFAGVMVFAGFSAFALVLGYGGQLMIEGRMSAGELTAFLLYTFGIATSVGQLGSLYGAYRQLRGASVRVFGILDQHSSLQEDAWPAPMPPATGGGRRLELDAVSFAYPGQDRPAIDGVSLRVEPGEVVGLVGPSGGGKSTLFALLQRFHDPDSGGVAMDGVDLRRLSVDELRRQIAVVPQDIFLFSGSVLDNLLVARPGADEEAARAAASAAGADEFIRELPEGYDTQVGERGLRLSGGQRQRLAIARAFLADRPVLLLDEATSSLDPDSEAHVQRALAELVVGRTTLVIAHRLATAHRADRLLVLEAGRVASSGTHAELLAASDLYRRYWELQSLEG